MPQVSGNEGRNNVLETVVAARLKSVSGTPRAGTGKAHEGSKLGRRDMPDRIEDFRSGEAIRGVRDCSTTELGLIPSKVTFIPSLPMCYGSYHRQAEFAQHPKRLAISPYEPLIRGVSLTEPDLVDRMVNSVDSGLFVIQRFCLPVAWSRILGNQDVERNPKYCEIKRSGPSRSIRSLLAADPPKYFLRSTMGLFGGRRSSV